MKNWLNKQKASGFTIIEVMIVLAIAGLIMVIVFIAIPQLQRNQRDNARQSTANRIKAEFETYAGNNQGLYPFVATGTGTGTISDYNTRYYNVLAANAKTNPSTGATYTIAFAAADGDNPTANQLMIHRGGSCSGELATGTSASTTTRKFALRIELDRGNFYCIDNG